jgi:hypothetical protein
MSTFRSGIGPDRSAGTGVVVLSATSVPVHRPALALLIGRSTAPSR